jgi:hypothetical protein
MVFRRVHMCIRWLYLPIGNGSKRTGYADIQHFIASGSRQRCKRESHHVKHLKQLKNRPTLYFLPNTQIQL